MTSFLRSGSIIAGVLILHAIGVFGGLYDALHWYDIPMHFLGGYAMAVLALDLWRAYVGPFATQGKWLVELVFVLGFVALIGIGWEWFEYIVDQVFNVSIRSGLAQMGLKDTLGDLVNDMLGGLVGFLAFRDRK